MIYAFKGCDSECCEIDTQTFELRFRERTMTIEPMAFDLLIYLIEHRERVVPKRELMERLWRDRMVCDSAVNHCVMVARKAVGDDGKLQRIIKTCHRRGYRFIAELVHGADPMRPPSTRLALAIDSSLESSRST